MARYAYEALLGELKFIIVLLKTSVLGTARFNAVPASVQVVNDIVVGFLARLGHVLRHEGECASEASNDMLF
jgi:hypothetical protein